MTTADDLMAKTNELMAVATTNGWRQGILDAASALTALSAASTNPVEGLAYSTAALTVLELAE